MIHGLLDTLFPGRCAGCDRPGPPLCRQCLPALSGAPAPARPNPAPAGLPPTFAVAPYDGAVRAALLAYKERGQVALAGALGAALARAVAAAVGSVGTVAVPVAVVPMPSSPRRRRQRGDDVVARLARHAAGSLRAAGVAATVVPALRVCRPVADSAGLSAAGRTANLRGAFTVSRAWRAHAVGSVVLVDDLVTTGATLAEAARALGEAGAKPVGGAVVAATRRRC